MKKKNFTFEAIKITALLLMVFINGLVLAQDEKITICHCPPGNPNKCHSITISINAWAAHLDHQGDYIGSCTDNPDLKLVEVIVAPNPSYGQSTIKYDLAEESSVKIDVYNKSGYKIKSIVNEEIKPIGTYYESFDVETAGFYLLNVTAVTAYEVVQSSQIIVEIK